MNSLKVKAKAVIPYKYHSVINETYLRLRSLLYAGNKFACPCCGGHFREFLPRKESGANTACPRCSSSHRHRLIWLYLKDKTNLFNENLKVLHIAPEYAFQRIFKAMSNLDYVSADLSSPLAMVKMDITNITYEDNYFDVILCSHVLEHVMDDQKAMKEFWRVLKPSGWAILQVPIHSKLDKTFEDPKIVLPEERERMFGRYDHVRKYARDYKDRLEEAGFTVKVDNYAKELGNDISKRYILGGEQIYFCSKQK